MMLQKVCLNPCCQKMQETETEILLFIVLTTDITDWGLKFKSNLWNAFNVLF